MKITEFRQRLLKYHNAAAARRNERLSFNDDTSWEMCVLQEMLMDAYERLEKLEALILPEDEKPEAPKPHIDPEELLKARAEAAAKAYETIGKKLRQPGIDSL